MIKNENIKRFKLNIEIECINTPEALKQMEARLSNLNFKELFSGEKLHITTCNESIESLLYGDIGMPYTDLDCDNYCFDVQVTTPEIRPPPPPVTVTNKVTEMPNRYFDY